VLCTLSISRNTHTHAHTHTLCWPSAERVVRTATVAVKVKPSILFQELLEVAMQLEIAEGSRKLVAVCYNGVVSSKVVRSGVYSAVRCAPNGASCLMQLPDLRCS
jgi:hypothetical protein